MDKFRNGDSKIMYKKKKRTELQILNNYELEKQKIAREAKSPEEYEKRIRYLVKRLGV